MIRSQPPASNEEDKNRYVYFSVNVVGLHFDRDVP